MRSADMDPLENDTEAKRYDKREITAEWRVPLHGKLYQVEFEHGTTTGKRVIWINGSEILRREWMFKLVGEDIFTIENVRCILRVDPAPGFKYNYLLFVDGVPLKQFTRQQAKVLKTWMISNNEKEYRIVLEKDSLNIFLNGELRDEVGEFVEGGTDTYFEKDENKFILSARASGNKREAFIYTLKFNGVEVNESKVSE